jgi:transposase
LGLRTSTLRQWVQNYEKDDMLSFRGKGIIRTSNEEMFHLKKELADVRLERDILKKAVAIFLKNKM